MAMMIKILSHAQGCDCDAALPAEFCQPVRLSFANLSARIWRKPPSAACANRTQKTRCFEWLLASKAMPQAASWSGEPRSHQTCAPVRHRHPGSSSRRSSFMPSPAACGHQAQEARCFKWLLVRRAAQQAAFWSGEPSIASIMSPGMPSASKIIDQKVFSMPSPACRCTKAGLERLMSDCGRGERRLRP